MKKESEYQEEPWEPVEAREISLKFKENRRYELKIGRVLYIFNGRESVTIPEEVLTHPDFTESTKKKFVIGGNA